MQSLTGKVTGNSLTAAEWNQLPSEVQNVITGLGITLSSGDLNQLGKAIAGYAANGDFYTDSGAADAYVLGVIGSKQTPTAYTDGFSAIFRAGNTNTGASTANIAGLGVKNIKTVAGADPAAGDIPAGDYIELRYDLANDWLDLTSLDVLAPVFTKSYTSPEQTITTTGTLSLTHSLGAPPELIQYRLICKTAEGNYSVNDEIIVDVASGDTGSDGFNNPVLTTTTIDIRYSSATNVFKIGNKTTGASFGITNANWKLIVRAWA